MKKIFALVLGVFALSTTTLASEVETFDNTESYDIAVVDSYDFDAPTVFTVEVVAVGVESFNVTEVAVNYTSVEGYADSVNSVIGFATYEPYKDLPVDYGIYSSLATFNYLECPNLTSTVTDYTKTVKTLNEPETYGSPSLVKRIATNVGKLTYSTYS